MEGLTSRHLAIISSVIVIVLVITIIGMDMAGFHSDDDLAWVAFETQDGNATFKCQVADDFYERQQGLMGVEELEQDRGMLFVFDSPRTVSFWMKDTLIPLDIIFINETGHVLNVAQADPEPGVPDDQLTHYDSNGAALWVVEINQGICESQGIVPGTHFTVEY